jgi:hypothetical protein
MVLGETTLARLLLFAAKGEAAEAQRYLGRMLKQGAPLADIRAEIEATIQPGFYFELIEALPWLDEESFGNPLVVKPAATATDVPAKIVELLTGAGDAGMRLPGLRARFSDKDAFDDALAELEAGQEILSVDEPVGGQRVRRYWITGAANLIYGEGGEVVRYVDPFAQAQEVLRQARAKGLAA